MENGDTEKETNDQFLAGCRNDKHPSSQEFKRTAFDNDTFESTYVILGEHPGRMLPCVEAELHIYHYRRSRFALRLGELPSLSAEALRSGRNMVQETFLHCGSLLPFTCLSTDRQGCA
jgi:hypothetical protein